MKERVHLDFRRVSACDAPLLKGWRNDEGTRRNSRRSGLIAESAEKWLETFANERPGRMLYIALQDNRPVGLIYSDEEGDGFCEISYVIAPERRGHGLGVLMVGSFVRRYAAFKRIRAFIYDGNTASQKIALAIGLRPGRRTATENDPRILVEWHS